MAVRLETTALLIGGLLLALVCFVCYVCLLLYKQPREGYWPRAPWHGLTRGQPTTVEPEPWGRDPDRPGWLLLTHDPL